MSRDLKLHACPEFKTQGVPTLPGDTVTTPMTLSMAGLVPEGTRWVEMQLVGRLNDLGDTTVKPFYARRKGDTTTGRAAQVASVGETNFSGSITQYTRFRVGLDANLEWEAWWGNTATLSAGGLSLEAFGR